MSLDQLFHAAGFTPTEAQRAAIVHTEGPLWLVAGPGSGKTRVLLWRTLNLIVFQEVAPETVLLSTFTDKAARQLRMGLLSLLHLASKHTGKTYDIASLYVGTVHALCRKILVDPRFGDSGNPPELLDALGQYFHVYDKHWWATAGVSAEDVVAILNPPRGGSIRHRATLALLGFCNRLSEECLSPEDFANGSSSPHKDLLARLYAYYLHSLAGKLDLSRLQSAALQRLVPCETAGEIFRHVIIDEYQDTNRVQEALFFKLTQATKNLCVVGDDDQALYRFRGATVDNLVRFDERCRTALAIDPTRIDLHVNFRSVPEIVGTYNHFIATHPDLHRDYRLAKTIVPHVISQGAGVVMSQPGALGNVCVEIAGLVRTLINQNIVADANQIAFLYPSVKSREAKAMIAALRQQGLAVYSPRSGRFLDGMEAKLIVGLLLQVLGKPGGAADSDSASQFAYFQNWLDACATVARNVLDDADEQDLAESVDALRTELDSLQPTGTTDWNLLDLFYRFCAAYRIQAWLNQASEDDEGPACNLALVSQYLSRYQKMRGLSVIRGSDIPRLRQDFFNGYLYGLYRLEQSAYEDEENPFPEGRIPFLTIHQAKGLEFPVVVLGSLKPFTQRTATVETLVRPWARPGAEPEEHLAAFDAMRMFYVALSRAKNLLVLPNISTTKSPRAWLDCLHRVLVASLSR